MMLRSGYSMMDICRNCGKQENNLEQYGTKHYYCSEACYEASYKSVNTAKELYDACKSWKKDILVEGDLVSYIILLKDVPEKIIKVCTKVLNLFGFKNLETPYAGNINVAQKIISGKLESSKGIDLFKPLGITLDDPDFRKWIYDILVALLVAGVLIYAIHSRYIVEVELDPVTGKRRLRLVPRESNDKK